MRYYLEINADFKCTHCRNHVSARSPLNGVNNRNHCPYCLWSRHMDLYKAGDRLSACKALMRPVGLTMKRSRNKYAKTAGGELMLVHQCIECERISINRIAADDVPEVMIEVFEASLSLSPRMRDQIQISAINLLGSADIDSIHRQLYGQLSPAAAYVFVQ